MNSRTRLRLLSTLVIVALAPGVLMAQEADSLQGLVNIRFQNDIRLFTVMAALNVAGFDQETEGAEMGGVRQAVRAELASVDPELQSRLRNFYEAKLAEGPSTTQPQAAYTSLALLLSGPPEFLLQSSEDDTPTDAQHVRGFQVLVREFYRAANIARLWEEYRPAYERELLSYQPVLKDVIQQTLKYFRVPARVVLDREIVLIPDLLDKKKIVNARNLERVYYIVVGPSDSPEDNRRQLQHEYLHFLVDPLIRKFGVSLMEHQGLLDMAQRQPAISSEYQNRFLLMVTESLIETLQLAMSDPEPETRERALVALFRQGLVLAPHFERGLQAYAKSEMVSLPTFMEPLLDSVDPDQVRQDERDIAALESQHRAEDEAQRAELEQAHQEQQQQAARDRLFREATRLMQQQQLDSAEAPLHQLLELDPEHGGAWFYLAQIAIQREAYSEALDAYRKSSQAASSPLWVRAWSLLRMGRILAAQGQIEAARRYLESVLELEGDLQGAREKAEESLSLLDRQP